MRYFHEQYPNVMLYAVFFFNILCWDYNTQLTIYLQVLQQRHIFHITYHKF